MNKVYATADWHGCLAPAKKLMNYLDKNDKLYYIGDSIDRGEDGIKLLNLLTKDKRVIYLRGNHEQMMLDALRDARNGRFSDAFYIWQSNGGNKTFKSIDGPTEAEKYIAKIEQMDIWAEYKSPKGHSVILEHAGFSLGHSTELHDPLWDRKHFDQPWGDEPGDENIYLVHGHTPVQYLQFEFGYIDCPPLTEEEKKIKSAWLDVPKDYYQPTIIRYCDGHKFDIDLCTIVSNRVALLDLDTFEVKYFEGEE